jgi:hypothetical protein
MCVGGNAKKYLILDVAERHVNILIHCELGPQISGIKECYIAKHEKYKFTNSGSYLCILSISTFVKEILRQVLGK